MEIITTHINADFDCLGSMIAAKKLYPHAELVFSGSQERSLREFFLKSSSYAYDFKRIRDIDFDRITRLILVDVASSERIGPFGDVARRADVEVHLYDHHPSGGSDLTPEFKLVEPVGATVTLFCRLLQEQNLPPTADEATMMMLGLYEDTGSLQFSSTTVADFHAAAYLLEQGASLNDVADFLTQELTAEQVALLHQLLQNLRRLPVNGVEVGLSFASIDGFVGDLAMLCHKLKDMENLDVLVTAARMGDRIFMVGRSRIPEVHVGEVLEEFGGGGHAFAASATLRDLTLVQLLEKLPEVLGRHANPRLVARELMSAPVRALQADHTLNQARQEMLRYNVNSMPVLQRHEVVGVVSRQIVDRAFHHGLAEQPVADFMLKEFATVGPETPSQQLQELLVDRQLRLVPVVEQGKLVGVLTRTDLMRHMLSLGIARGYRSREELGQAGPWLKKKRLSRFLDERLPQRVRELFHRFAEVADANQVRLYVVGGMVRDLLLRSLNLDVDIVVEGDGIEFARAFAAQHECRVRSHKKFGTAVLIFPDGFKVDVASARTEFYHRPAALPTVEEASLKLDLYRRDFTINTLAIALNKADYGELVDYFGGQRDLKDKAIRVLHNLSFVEDPTRVFRAVRFEQRLGFRIGKPTEHLLRNAVRLGFVEKVGGARVFRELELILREANPWPALQRLAEFTLLQQLHARLELNGELAEIFREAGKALSWHELLYVGEAAAGWKVYLLCLLSHLEPKEVASVCERLRVPPAVRELLAVERGRAHRALRFLWQRLRRGAATRPSEIYHRLHLLSIEAILYLLARCNSETLRKQLSHYVSELQPVRNLLDGKALQQLGLSPGPEFKRIFQVLLEAKLDGKVVSREDEITLVKRRFLPR